ncbi:MAG TPA: BrnT family toxin [Candidatus Tyrphobacter sp.]
MRVVWDPAKSRMNLRNHGIAFADAATVLDDPMALTIEDRRFSEQRFVTVGRDLLGRTLVVVYGYPEGAEDIRIISARRASPSETEEYENG